jgi:hypothetical protein
MTRRSSISRVVRVLAAALTAAVAFPLAAAAQKPPLAEVARQEQERRKEIKTAKKMLTNKDLPASALQPAAPSAGAPAAGGAGEAAGAGTQKPAAPGAEAQAPPQGGQKDEAYWRTRITTARENLRRSEAALEAFQSRINALTTDFVNRDDPYQRQKIGEDRQKALEELDRVRREIEGFKTQISDIEEEARKAGVPPGWLR